MNGDLGDDRLCLVCLASRDDLGPVSMRRIISSARGAGLSLCEALRLPPPELSARLGIAPTLTAAAAGIRSAGLQGQAMLEDLESTGVRAVFEGDEHYPPSLPACMGGAAPPVTSSQRPMTGDRVLADRGRNMCVLVVGSVAIDTVETPFGTADSILGGSAVYFSLAASLFAPVRLVGVVGRDFPAEHYEIFRGRPIDTQGLTVAEGKTFRWAGRYEGLMNEAATREVQLNVLGDFCPTVPEAYRGSPFVFLANGPPRTQLHVLEQVAGTGFVMADTMNLWVETEREAVLDLLAGVDALILNDGEARQLSGESSLLKAARWIRRRRPRCCIIKKAEHGALLVTGEGVFVLPAFPTENVVDPTGAGDSFAGGLMGYAAQAGAPDVTHRTLQHALAWATVAASFTIEGFGTTNLQAVGRQELEARLGEFKRMTHLPGA